MHITMDKLREGECLPFTWLNCIVLLNGERVERAFEADDEEGWVKRFIVNGGDLAEETLYGEVEFDVH